jgi:hypothetical protein
MQAARRDIDKGRFPRAVVAYYTDQRRGILEDGRHRVLVAMRTGHVTYPIIVRRYGPRGGLRSQKRANLELDALP